MNLVKTFSRSTNLLRRELISVGALILLLALLASCSRSGTADVEEVVPHEVGVAYLNLETGEALVYNGYMMFHAASTMKTPVMFQLFRMQERGEIDLNDKITVTNSFTSIVDGSTFHLPMESEEDEILFSQLGKKLSYYELMDKMITHSSNLATNILIQEAKPESISVTLNQIPAPGVMVLRGVEDLKAYHLGLNNQTSAFGMMKLMEAVYRSEMVSDSSRAEMLEILKRQHYNSMIPAGLPEDVVVAHKTGSITRIAHDAAIVIPPDSPPFVLVILTRGWDDGDEARRVGARLTEHVYQIHQGEMTTTEIPIPELIK